MAGRVVRVVERVEKGPSRVMIEPHGRCGLENTKSFCVPFVPSCDSSMSGRTDNYGMVDRSPSEVIQSHYPLS